jgi:DNA primase
LFDRKLGKMSSNVLDELSEYMDDCHRYEHYLMARCCFHDDTRPSLMINEKTYSCKSCGAFGNTSKLLEKLGKLPSKPHKQSRSFNPFSAWIKRYNRIGLVLKAAHENIKQRPSTYLRDRGIEHSIQLELSMGYLDNWYTFPIRNADGKIEGAVARRGENNISKSKYVIPAGQSPNLVYTPSWQRIIEAKVIFLTFGVFDCISLYLCGVASMSTTTGKQLDPAALNKIQKHIYIWPDFGEEKEGQRLANQLGWRGHCLFVNYPVGTKDPSDLYNLARPLLMTTLEKYK